MKGVPCRVLTSQMVANSIIDYFGMYPAKKELGEIFEDAITGKFGNRHEKPWIAAIYEAHVLDSQEHFLSVVYYQIRKAARKVGQ